MLLLWWNQCTQVFINIHGIFYWDIRKSRSWQWYSEIFLFAWGAGKQISSHLYSRVHTNIWSESTGLVSPFFFFEPCHAFQYPKSSWILHALLGKLGKKLKPSNCLNLSASLHINTHSWHASEENDVVSAKKELQPVNRKLKTTVIWLRSLTTSSIHSENKGA